MNLYTCKHYLPNILIIIVTFIPILIGIYCICNYNNPFVGNKSKLLRNAIVFICVGIIFLLIYFISYFNNYINIFSKKNSDSLQIVEGYVSKLSTTEFLECKYDKFYVDDIEFMVSLNSLTPGYSKPAAYGGVINKEDMYVKISYVEYQNNNYIMAIEEIVKKTVV